MAVSSLSEALENDKLFAEGFAVVVFVDFLPEYIEKK